MRDTADDVPILPGIFPDYSAPVVRNAPDGVRELSLARRGTPSLKGRKSDPGVTTCATSRRHTGDDGWAREADVLPHSRLF